MARKRPVGYYQQVTTKNGVKGISGIYQGVEISFKPIDEFKWQEDRIRFYKKKLGSII